MDWGLLSTTILTIGFGVATLILTIKVTKNKKPVWAYSTKHIIGRDAEAPPELKYVFGDKVVDEVYKTTIIFFNQGNDKFCGDLVVDGNRDINEPILVKFADAEILRPPTITCKSKGVGNFTVEQDRTLLDSIQLHVPILNHNAGAIIEVWHTKCNSIDIVNEDIPLLKTFIRQRPEGFWQTLTSLLLSLLIFFVIGIFSVFMNFDSKDVVKWILPTITTIGFVATVGTYGLTRVFRYRLFPSWSRTNGKLQQK